MESCAEADEVALRMDAGRNALHLRGGNDACPWMGWVEWLISTQWSQSDDREAVGRALRLESRAVLRRLGDKPLQKCRVVLSSVVSDTR